MKVSIKNENISCIVIVVMVLYFYFYPHIVNSLGGKYCYPILFVVAIVSIAMLLVRKTILFTTMEYKWMLILLISTFRNVGIERGSYLWPCTFFVLIIGFLGLCRNVGWHEKCIKWLKLISLIYVTCTIMFYIMPNLYDPIFSYWDIKPNGTENGTLGYRAGLADNHSANGTYCSVLFMISGCELFFGVKEKNKKLTTILFLICAFASVLLTTKRAHLIFSIAALLVVYYYTKGNRVGRMFKIISIAMLLFVLFQIAAPYIPAVSDMLDGFYGEDDISNGRYEFWSYAINLFKQNPIIGIGWLGFRYNQVFFLTNAGFVDAHNVYLQLLCETGIIGFIIVISTFIQFFNETVKLMNVCKVNLLNNYRDNLAISLGFQVFCLIYGFTGNFLYDRTFFVYIFACAITCSIKRRLLYKGCV